MTTTFNIVYHNKCPSSAYFIVMIVEIIVTKYFMHSDLRCLFIMPPISCVREIEL